MSRDTARKVLEIEAEAIRELIPRLDESFDGAVETLHACSGPVVVTGMGKSGLIGRRERATRALDVLETRQITSLLVADQTGHIEGVLHLHDLWKTGMI